MWIKESSKLRAVLLSNRYIGDILRGLIQMGIWLKSPTVTVRGFFLACRMIFNLWVAQDTEAVTMIINALIGCKHQISFCKNKL